MPDAKTCPRCGKSRPLGDFHRRARSRDGRQRLCKDCSGAVGAEYRNDPERHAIEIHYKRAYHRALAALRDRHRDEFDRLYEAEKEANDEWAPATD